MHSTPKHPDETAGDHVDATLAEEFAEARLALTRLLEDLAERPERLLARSPDDLIGELTGAYRAALERLAAQAPTPTSSEEPDDSQAPEEPEAPEEPPRAAPVVAARAAVVDLRGAFTEPQPQPEPAALIKIDVGHGAKAMVSPASAALIRDLPEIARTLRELHDVGTPDMIQRAVGRRIERGLPGFDDDVMTDLIHLFVALLRFADERASSPDDSARMTSSLFRTLRFDYTEERRLYIHGMALAHSPKHGMAWSHDVAYWLDALEARVEAVDPASLNEPTTNASPKPRAAKPASGPSIQWPKTFGWSGRSIEFLGANHNPELIDELLELTGARRIEWTPLQRGAPNMRLVQTMCERIERGSVDLAVVFTAFATHKATQRLKKSLNRAPHVRALWANGIPSAKNLHAALLEHPEAHI